MPRLGAIGQQVVRHPNGHVALSKHNAKNTEDSFWVGVFQNQGMSPQPETFIRNAHLLNTIFTCPPPTHQPPPQKNSKPETRRIAVSTGAFKVFREKRQFALIKCFYFIVQGF